MEREGRKWRELGEGEERVDKGRGESEERRREKR